MSKILAFLKRPAVSHTLAVALTVAGTSLATGHLDLTPLLQLLGAK